MSHEDVLHMDQMIMARCFSPACGDFSTGVKALIFEKRKPKWRFSKIEDIPP